MAGSGFSQRRGGPPKAASPIFEPVAPAAAPVPAAKPPAPAPAAAAPAPAPTKQAQQFRARRSPIRHPYQNVMVPVSGSVPLMLDNWVEVQLKARVIERV